MLKICFLVFYFFIGLFNNGFSQSAALPFLRHNTSPELNSMGGAFTALPTNSPFGQFFNPAQLGNFSFNKNLSSEFYINRTNWLPTFTNQGMTFNAHAIAA